MIVDASALLTIVFREAGSGEFRNRLLHFDGILQISVLNLWEARSVTVRRQNRDHEHVLASLEDALSMTVVPADAKQLDIACTAWRCYGRGSGHPAKLNMGDCFAYALARAQDMPLLYKGDDFSHTDIEAAL